MRNVMNNAPTYRSLWFVVDLKEGKQKYWCPQKGCCGHQYIYQANGLLLLRTTYSSCFININLNRLSVKTTY